MNTATTKSITGLALITTPFVIATAIGLLINCTWLVALSLLSIGAFVTSIFLLAGSQLLVDGADEARQKNKEANGDNSNN